MCRQNRSTQDIPSNRPWFVEELPLAHGVSFLEQLQMARPLDPGSELT